MNRILIVFLALICGACQTVREGGTPSPNPNAERISFTRKQLTWFAVAAYLRHCHGFNSTRGAILAATAASIGGVYLMRTAPRSVSGTPQGRQRVSALMETGYKGRIGKIRARVSCTRVSGAVAATYRRQPDNVKRIIARLSGTLLRTDAPGRRAIAQLGYRRRASRRTYIRRAARIRRGSLKPSEQQLPVGN